MENGRRELFVQNFNQKLSLLMACIPSLVSDEAFYVGMSFVRLEESVCRRLRVNGDKTQPAAIEAFPKFHKMDGMNSCLSTFAAATPINRNEMAYIGSVCGTRTRICHHSRARERERKSEAVFTSLGRDEDKAVHQDRIISDCFLLCGHSFVIRIPVVGW